MTDRESTTADLHPGSDHRPSWDEYFMTLANEVRTRTTCMRRGVGAIIVKDIDEAFEVSNYLAPEHLEVLVNNPVNTLPKIKNAGSIFLGEYSPEPLGDYMSGTNHVLPTGGTAKFYSALGVYDFVKYSSYSYYPKNVLSEFKDDVIKFANSEGLDGHANSIAVRFEEE